MGQDRDTEAGESELNTIVPMRRLIDAIIDVIYPRAPGEPDRDGLGVKLLVLGLLAIGLFGLYLSSRLGP